MVFSFKTKLEEPELYILKYEQGEILNLLLSPGEKVSISTTIRIIWKRIRGDGSEESENIRFLVEHLDQNQE